MPHKCTSCDTIYNDGDKAILSGCDDCGGNKFEYVSEKPTSVPTNESPETEDTKAGSDIIIADESQEENAQERARSETLSEEELERFKQRYNEQQQADEKENVSEAPSNEGIEQVRQALNEQFEGIKILEPGKYELNLMELYEREEHIISLQEDGRYIIQFPEQTFDR